MLKEIGLSFRTLLIEQSQPRDIDLIPEFR